MIIFISYKAFSCSIFYNSNFYISNIRCDTYAAFCILWNIKIRIYLKRKWSTYRDNHLIELMINLSWQSFYRTSNAFLSWLFFWLNRQISILCKIHLWKKSLTRLEGTQNAFLKHLNLLQWLVKNGWRIFSLYNRKAYHACSVVVQGVVILDGYANTSMELVKANTSID